MSAASPNTTADTCGRCEPLRNAPAHPPRIGRAFEECLRCGQRVVRPGVTEWDFHERPARRAILVRRAEIVFVGGFVGAALHLVAVWTTPRVWLWSDALAALVGGWIVVGLWEAVRLGSEIHRSRQRLSGDPMYQAKLVEHGIAESRGGGLQ